MALKLRAPVPFPANVQGSGGIKVGKANGIWTIEPGFDEIGSIVSLADPSAKQIWVFDPLTGEYAVLTLTALGQNLFTSTSATSIEIGADPVTLATQNGRLFAVGSPVVVTSAADSSNYMILQITSYANGSLTGSLISSGGSGTFADWIISAGGTDASAAADFATAAATSATNAATSETNAGTSATNAAASETAAETAKTAAEAAQAAAESAADNFDDVYLGSKTSDPTLDNDGNALVEGQLYWNNVSNALKVYDGAAWQSYNPTSGIANIVEDTTPQLGGNLDLNGHTITGLVIGTNVQAFDAQLSSLIRQNSQSAAYTLALTDGGKNILHPSADTTARIWTIPANSSVAFPIGTAITFVNQNAAGVITISITTDTMRLAGAGTTGSRTLAANGTATALKITSTEWLIAGTGLT